MLDCRQNEVREEALDLVLDAGNLEGEQEIEQRDAVQDEVQAELEAHEEWGFYVPTREELMGTTGEFFLHMLMERE